MFGKASPRRNARILKALSFLYLLLTGAALLLVHTDSYQPAVSFLLLYLVVSMGVTLAGALLLLQPDQFTGGFVSLCYAAFATFIALATFFSGGVSSELYILYFPLILGSVLHGSWSIGVSALASILLSYSLATLPGLLSGASGEDAPALVFFRLFILAATGIFALALGRSATRDSGLEDGHASEGDGSMFLEWVSGELSAHRGVQVAVVLVDPGWVRDVELLLERIRSRIGEPVLLGEGAVFGLVLSGVDDQAVESAARRALATAGFLGSGETRAGAAVYPRDARSAEELLIAAGQALEAAFEIESPGAIVLSGRGTSGLERRAAP